MYYKISVTKQDGSIIECWIKQTCDTRQNSHSMKGEIIPTSDFLIRYTDQLNVGEYIVADISELTEDYWYIYDGMAKRLPLLVTAHSNLYYDLYSCVTLIPDYKTKLEEHIWEE